MSMELRYLSSRSCMLRKVDQIDDRREWITIHRNMGGFYVSIEHVQDVSLTSVRRALIAAAKDDSLGVWGAVQYASVEMDAMATLLLSDAPWLKLDDKYGSPSDVWLDLDSDGELVASVTVQLFREDWDEELITKTLGPFVRSARAGMKEIDSAGDGPYGENPETWRLRLRFPYRNRTVKHAYDLGQNVLGLLQAADRGSLDARSAFELVRGGRVQALFGQPESKWLEVKSLPWPIDTEAGKIECSQDVSRFGNSTEDGLLVVGLGARRVEGTEIVTDGPQLFFRESDAVRIHKILDQRIFPPLEGLEVVVAPNTKGGQLIAIFVPSQPEELKPFLVNGAIVGGRVEGAFFSIVRRRGEHSIPVSAAAVHAALSAGRALLRRGELPPGNEPG